jgi:putative DNA primase/helicase
MYESGKTTTNHSSSREDNVGMIKIHEIAPELCVEIGQHFKNENSTAYDDDCAYYYPTRDEVTKMERIIKLRGIDDCSILEEQLNDNREEAEFACRKLVAICNALEFMERCNIKINPKYPLNEHGFAALFYDFIKKEAVFVLELKWFFYDGKVWRPNNGHIEELCKIFAEALFYYAREHMCDSHIPRGEGKYLDLISVAGQYQQLCKRKSLISDASTIAPMSIAEFDNEPLFFNVENGCYDLKTCTFREHRASDSITLQAHAKYVESARCERFEKFIFEIMDGNIEKAKFMQKALGYTLSGKTNQHCFFLLYGKTTRNGKSTLLGTIEHLLGDYAITAQPQTLAKRKSNGSAPTPDIARFKGIRFANMPEPSRGLDIDAALLKQFTGGDKIVARFLRGNPVEFLPEFKIFISTNHLLKITDRSLFDSGRLMLITFSKHFEKQDRSLKEQFQTEEAKSGILNWLLEGYRMYKEEGLLQDENGISVVPDWMSEDIKNFRKECLGELEEFLSAHLVPIKGGKVKINEVHARHCIWAKDSDLPVLPLKAFFAELRDLKFYEEKRDSKLGNIISGYVLKEEPKPIKHDVHDEPKDLPDDVSSNDTTNELDILMNTGL